MTCVISFTSVRLRIFSSFHQRILDHNLEYVYILISLLSLSVMLIHFIYSWLEDWMLNTLHSKYNYVLAFSLVNIIYHFSLFVMFKVNYLKMKIQNISGAFKLVSIILLHILLGYYTVVLSLARSSSNSLTSLTIRVTNAIFETSVITIYFQNSFLMSVLLWVIIVGLASYGALIHVSRGIMEYSVVVSPFCTSTLRNRETVCLVGYTLKLCTLCSNYLSALNIMALRVVLVHVIGFTAK